MNNFVKQISIKLGAFYIIIYG